MKNLSRLLLLSGMSFVLNGGALATGVIEEVLDNQKPTSGLPTIEENVELPSDIIAHIASYTRIREGYSMEVVNKAWNAAFQKNEIWQEYAKRLPGYLRAKEQYQAESSQVNDRKILKELLKPKVQMFPKMVFPTDWILRSYAISEDGRTIVGQTDDKRYFVFTEKEGFDRDSTLNFAEESAALGISADGKTIVGWVANTFNGRKEAFIREEKKEKTILPALNGGQSSKAIGLSDDYKTVVGEAVGGLNELEKAVIWKTDEGAVLTLDDHIGFREISNAVGISKDGRFVAGTITDSDCYKQYGFFLDTKNNRITYFNSENGVVSAISANGEKVVGVAGNIESKKEEAFIYDTVNQQNQFLGTINDGNFSEVTGLSADGKVAVGYSVDGSKDQKEDSLEFYAGKPTPETHASFIYYGNGIGMQPVKQLLQGQLSEVEYPFSGLKISGDGTIIVPTDSSTWYAYIPRYDILREEGLNLLPQIDEQNNQG
ncbi:hypothetical protein IM40_01615 [Candidatus Paracaedimonas acanthamoebae]|nr:hypothetical protein IM40_01615 [Candidatus Paracaedimonas acanthamoebae]